MEEKNKLEQQGAGHSMSCQAPSTGKNSQSFKIEVNTLHFVLFQNPRTLFILILSFTL
jgi:hypothetical protein